MPETMLTKEKLYSLSTTALILRISRVTVADLVRILEIETKSDRFQVGRLLSVADVEKIARYINYQVDWDWVFEAGL